jgi:hypothetical protein
MNTRFSIFLALLLVLASTCTRAGEAANFTTLIFTSREALEDYYRKQAIDPHRYRIGSDIVVFIGDRSAGKPTTLYMCAAEEFTKQELKSFLPSTRRKDLPARNDPIFDRLQVTGRRAGFH